MSTIRFGEVGGRPLHSSVAVGFSRPLVYSVLFDYFSVRAEEHKLIGLWVLESTSIRPHPQQEKNLIAKKRNLGASQLQAAKEGIPRSTETW